MKQQKLLLISANTHTNPYPVYPLGLAYIASAIKRQLPHYTVRVFDFMLNQGHELKNVINEFKPDSIGISLRNIDDIDIQTKHSFDEDYKSIIDTIRSISKAVIIIGGAGFSIYPVKLFDYLQPDFGVYGEGEDSLCRLLSSLETGSSYHDIGNLVYSLNGKTIFNKRISYFKDIQVEYDPTLLDYYWKNSGMLNVQTKRGCPFKCIYCTYPVIEGKKVRTLDIDNIINTIKTLYETKGIDYIFFTDSVFNINKKYNLEFARKLIKSNVKVHWNAYFTPWKLDDESIKLFKEAGLTHIEFGTESLSDKQLKNYGKHFNFEDVLRVSELCIKNKIYFAHSLILGGYGETEETLAETFNNCKKINNTVYFPYIGMRIYPGTKLCKYAIKEGKIKADDPLIVPKWYLADGIDAAKIKSDAIKTGKSWLFPDEDISVIMAKMRAKNKKGPLWHHLIK
jgi:radical SAM superfamily enzyme YgiQ (UPF0313 family)